MFDHALKSLSAQEHRLPSHAWLPVYEGFQMALDPDADPSDYVAVPIWVRQLGGCYFGLRLRDDAGEPFAEAGDVLVVWMGRTDRLTEHCGGRELRIWANRGGGIELADDRELLLQFPLRPSGLVLAVLRPQGQGLRRFQVVFELPSAAVAGCEGAWVH